VSAAPRRFIPGRYMNVTVEAGTFTYSESDGFNLSQNPRAWTEDNGLRSDDVPLQLAQDEDARRADATLDRPLLGDHNQVDRADLAAEASIYPHRFLKDQMSRHVDMAVYGDARALFNPGLAGDAREYRGR
jgi:hypothetical protein